MTGDYKTRALEIVGFNSDRTASTWAHDMRNQLLSLPIEAAQGVGAAIEARSSLEVVLEAARRQIDAEREGRARQLVSDELLALVSEERLERDSIGPADVAPALAFLNTELGALMARVRKLDAKAGAYPPSMSQLAADPSLAETWADLESAAADYAELRAAQRHLTGVYGKVPRDTQERSGFFRDALEVDTPARKERAWAARRTPYVLGEESLLEWLGAAPSVPFERDDREIFGADPIAYIRWIATNTRPWVPTVAELLAVDAVVGRIVRAVVTRKALDGIHDDLGAYFTEPIVPSAPLPQRPEIRPAKVAR